MSATSDTKREQEIQTQRPTPKLSLTRLYKNVKERQQKDNKTTNQNWLSGTVLLGVILFLFTLVPIISANSDAVDSTERIHTADTLQNTSGVSQNGNLSADVHHPDTKLTYINTKTKCVKLYFDEYMHSLNKKYYHLHRRRKRRSTGDQNVAGKNDSF